MSLPRRARDKVGSIICAVPDRRRGDFASVLILLFLSTVLFANVLFSDPVMVSESTERFYPWNHYATVDLNQMRLNDALDRIIEEFPQRLVAPRMVKRGAGMKRLSSA